MEPEVYKLITTHRTIRRYKPGKIPSEHLEKIINSAIRAPSSSNLQSYCIIRITDPILRKRVAKLAGDQEHIYTASEFFIFIADTNRLIQCGKEFGIETAEPNIRMLYVSTVDAAIAAQNMVLTAESLGYGTCYIGAVQNDPCGIAELLNLPKHTYPLFGLTIGIPDEDPPMKPRLPKRALVHLNTYVSNGENVTAAMEAFKGTEYYDSFKRRILRYYSKNGRYEIRFRKMVDCLRKMGYKLE